MPVDARPRVMVVDDDPAVQAVVRIALGKAGLSVTTADDAEGALGQLSDGAPDLVILDVVMPDATGWEVLRRIRERSDVPVLMLSARDSEVDKARGLDLGADDYVTKPFSLLEFEARVRRLLRRRPAADANRA
jgi:DNA-binding response OmpR family regulator